MSNNIVKPDKIILIDDGSTENVKAIIHRYIKKLNIEYVRNNKPGGVNSAWNQGLELSKKYNPDYVSILNNDLILNHYFFKKIIDVFNKFPKAGIVCPNTIKKAYIDYDDASPIDVIRMTNREGWAFTLKYEIYKKAGPIPTNIFKQFCGDDYFFFMSRYLGYINLKIKNNIIYHHKNTTLKSEIPDWKGGLLQQEKLKYNKWKKEYINNNRRISC
jgi:GT2 family glycosyltransferase